jgi:hypothetical protein
MPTTEADIVNRSLELIDSQTTITSLTDGTPAANAAQIYFTPTVNLVLRELDPAFARRTSVLSLAVGALAPGPWVYEYVYPAECVRLRQVCPKLYDRTDPPQVLFQVAFDVVLGTPTKVILANTQFALAVYTTTAATLDQWDPAFAEAVARRLANPLALSLSGRPDLARELLEEAERYAQLAGSVDEA